MAISKPIDLNEPCECPNGDWARCPRCEGVLRKAVEPSFPLSTVKKLLEETRYAMIRWFAGKEVFRDEERNQESLDMVAEILKKETNE